jgi:hypothetical protein
MKPMEIFRLAVAEIGDVSAAELSAHLEKKHGVKIEPAYIPVFRETLKELEKTAKLREAARSTPPKEPAQST